MVIPNVWTAVDAGTVVSTDNVRNQFQGAAVFGTSLALFSEITATTGVIDQSNFHDYQLARMNSARETFKFTSSTAKPLPQASASPASRLLHRRYVMLCSPRQVNGFANCPCQKQN